MLSTETEINFWQFENQELADPELADKLVLSLCSICGVTYPHFKLHLLVSEMVSNAIDHGVLSLHSHLKESNEGFDRYLIERSRRLKANTTGKISISAEWVDRNLLQISVQDSGAGFDFGAYSDNTQALDECPSMKLHGRGLVIVRSLCKSVTHLGDGSITVVEFDISAS